jgi:hypothetical protein
MKIILIFKEGNMLTAEILMAIDKSNIPEAANTLDNNDIRHLIDWLSLKDDKLRYQAFLLLQARSASSSDVYPYWDVLKEKLKSDNSYQRSIGAMLLAENAKWDNENKTEDFLDCYLKLLNDEKPITIRQSIQSIGKIAEAKPQLLEKISNALMELNLENVKETMRKSILVDILDVLFLIRKAIIYDKIEGFILNALSGEILDAKTKKQYKAQL